MLSPKECLVNQNRPLALSTKSAILTFDYIYDSIIEIKIGEQINERHASVCR